MDRDKLEFKTTIEDVIRLFGPEGIIYSQDHTVFIRELIQNSMDSIEIYKRQELNENFEGEINVYYADRKIIIEDNGWGLDREGVEEHFARPLTGIQRYLESGAQVMNNVIGHFGVGFLSVFKSSEYVEIDTKRRGCDAVSLIMGLKREFVEGKSDIRLDSYFIKRDNRFNYGHGMKVTIYLGAANDESDTSRRAELIDNRQDVINALNYYVKHPPADIRVNFMEPDGRKTRIEGVPFRGSASQLLHKINIEGIEGVLAYSAGLETPLFQVCQRGLLVKENYPTILPDNTGSITGEINFLQTDIVDLSLSRETFIENEKFSRLRSMLQEEIREYDKKFRMMLEEKQVKDDAGAGKKIAVNEDSDHATQLLESYKRGIQKNLYHHKICEEVKFFVETEDKYMLLSEIVDFARSKNADFVYLYALELKFLSLYANFDGQELYSYDKTRAGAVAYLKDQGGIVIRLKLREQGARMSFQEIVEEYLKNAGIGVKDVEPGKIIQSQNDFPISAGKLDIKTMSIKDNPGKKAFTYKYSSYSDPIVYMNLTNAQVREIFEAAHGLDSPAGKLLVRAYCQALACDLDSLLGTLHELIMGEASVVEEQKKSMADAVDEHLETADEQKNDEERKNDEEQKIEDPPQQKPAREPGMSNSILGFLKKWKKDK